MTQKTYIIWPIECEEHLNNLLCAMFITNESLEQALIAYPNEFDVSDFSGVLGWAVDDGTECGTAEIELKPKVIITKNKTKRKK